MDFLERVAGEDALGGEVAEGGVGDQEVGGVRGALLLLLFLVGLTGLGGLLGAGDAVLLQEREEVGFGELKAEGAEGDAQFVVVEVAVVVEVEEGEL